MKSDTCERSVIFVVVCLTQNTLGTNYPFILRIMEGVLSCSEVGGAYSKAFIYTLALHCLYIFTAHFLV
jgi:hypothetical protein